jgi:hypothetical protein
MDKHGISCWRQLLEKANDDIGVVLRAHDQPNCCTYHSSAGFAQN